MADLSEARSVSARGKPCAALILAGAAAKGPYAAGALTRLASHDRFHITSVAGASSGALNGAVYAAGLRVNEPARAAETLERLWINQASWSRILSWKQRQTIVRGALAQFSELPTRRDVRFRAVLASLRGTADRFERLRFEHSEAFCAEDFRDEQRLNHMAEVCVASAALPLVFKPREVGHHGQFWDGGIVDNAPIGWALKDPSVDHIVVITPDSAQPGKQRYSRVALGRLINMLIDERLGRDLHEAESFNEELMTLRERISELQETGGQALAEAVLAHMGWRTLKLIEVRPDRDLEGSLLSGFLSSGLRKAYVQAGQAAAEGALAAFA